MILNTHGRTKQRHVLTGAQIAAILGLEELVKATGLVIVCPHCTAEGDPFVDTDNDPQAAEWRIDCGCRERRILAKNVTRPMDADGDLIAQANEILKPVSLTLRCPQKKCLNHPLEIERTPTTTIVRCRCAKTTLHPPNLRVH
jgi:hypothetical protein